MPQTEDFGQNKPGEPEPRKRGRGRAPSRSAPWRRRPAGPSPHDSGGRGAAVGAQLPPATATAVLEGLPGLPSGKERGKKERGRTSLTGRRGRRRGGGRWHGGPSQQKRPGACLTRGTLLLLFPAPDAAEGLLRAQRALPPGSLSPRGGGGGRKMAGRAGVAARARRGRARGATTAARRARGERGSGAAEGGLPGVFGGRVHP